MKDADDEELSEKAQKIIDILKGEYRRLTEGVARNRTLPRREGFKGSGVVSDFAELVLIHQCRITRKARARAIQAYWRSAGRCSGVRRLAGKATRHRSGHGRSACDQLRYQQGGPPVAVWANAGLDVGPDGFARSRRAAHLIEREYKAKDGEIKKKMSTTFDPWLQSRMLGVLGGSLLRSKSPYRKFYDEYKHRITTDPTGPRARYSTRSGCGRKARLKRQRSSGIRCAFTARHSGRW